MVKNIGKDKRKCISFGQYIKSLLNHYNRNEFLWIGKSTENVLNKTIFSKGEVYFGKYEAAFDKFELEEKVLYTRQKRTLYRPNQFVSIY
jgi:hypothetical protein